MAGEIIRPSALPARATPVASEIVPSDNGSAVGGVTWAAGVAAGRPLANQPEAEAGVNATKAMTPLTTKQAIAAQAVVSIVAGDNTTIDTSDPNNPVISYDGSAVTDGDKGDVVVSGSGGQWAVARRFSTVAALLADTQMDYSAGTQTVSAGQVVEAQGFRYEIAASDATDFHVESAGNVKLYALPGEDGYSVLQWGAVADVDLTVDRVNWTGATDNTATMLAALADIIARDGGGVIHSPPGCLVDYSGVNEETAAGMAIIDDSHIDYARPTITNQVNTYWRQFTAVGEFGAWNGNTKIISGNHNPGLGIESRATAGTQSARASLVFWHGDAQADAQIVYDRATTDAPFFSINSYGSLVNGTTLLSIAGQGHPYFRQVAVNTGFYPSATLTWFLAGHSTDGDYLTKAFLEVYSLPASSTGDFTKLFRVGSTVKARQYVMNDGAFQWWASNSGTPRMVYSATGALYGHRRLIKNVTTNASLAVNDSAQHVTNVDAGGGAVLTLPAAAVGLHYSFSVDSANNLRIDPNGTDLFVNMAAGKYMESATIGSECSVTCVKAGVWTFRRSGTWTDEP